MERVKFDVSNCRNCGSKDYRIQMLYVGYRQRAFIIECSECRYDLIPVVVKDFEAISDVDYHCLVAWNAANDIDKEAK